MNTSAATNANSALDQLPPLMLPDTIGWWPLALGWWLVIAVTITVVSLLTYAAYRHHRQGRLRRATQKLAKQYWSDYETHLDADAYLVQMVQLIRRFCLHQYNDALLIRSSGKQWLQQLDNLLDTPLLNNTNGELLLTIYQPPLSSDKKQQSVVSHAQLQQTHTLILRWLRQVPLTQAPLKQAQQQQQQDQTSTEIQPGHLKINSAINERVSSC